MDPLKSYWFIFSASFLLGVGFSPPLVAQFIIALVRSEG
jgi:hypothetical protein